MELRRRHLLGAGAVALTGTTAACAAPWSRPEGDASPRLPTGATTIPFHGAHQAGIDTPPQTHVSLLGLDLKPGTDRERMRRLLGLISDDGARLTQGDAALADLEPELAARPARLTVTVGLGPAVMARHVPAVGLRALPAYDVDALDDRWGQTDLLVQVCCDDPVTLAHARRLLLRDVRAFTTLRWQQDGFREAPGTDPGATMRNLFGQVDGTVNPSTPAEFDDLVWSDDAAWAGGTFVALRRIETDLDAWERADRLTREFSVGRRLGSGAPLTGEREDDPVLLGELDEHGFPVIDPASHVARARGEAAGPQFLRRGYNYEHDGRAGQLFLAWTRDLEGAFVPALDRVSRLDLLQQWLRTVGSAVYAVPPGAREGERLAEGLI